jgi:hypothetical protein
MKGLQSIATQVLNTSTVDIESASTFTDIISVIINNLCSWKAYTGETKLTGPELQESHTKLIIQTKVKVEDILENFTLEEKDEDLYRQVVAECNLSKTKSSMAISPREIDLEEKVLVLPVE